MTAPKLHLSRRYPKYRRSPPPRPAKADWANPNQLWLDLFITIDFGDEEPVESYIRPNSLTRFTDAMVLSKWPEVSTWTHEDAVAVCDAMVHYHLKASVDARVSPENRMESLKWVFDEADETQPPPMSFVGCCVMAGLDPDALREGFTRTLRSIAKRRQEAQESQRDKQDGFQPDLFSQRTPSVERVGGMAYA